MVQSPKVSLNDLHHHMRIPATSRPGTEKFLDMQGYIKALQTENACSSSEAMNVQTSWVSVANVSFSDMLKSVEQQSLPERRKAAQELPAAPTSEPLHPVISLSFLPDLYQKMAAQAACNQAQAC